MMLAIENTDLVGVGVGLAASPWVLHLPASHGLFVPKPNRGADCQGCGPSDLGTTVRQRPPASGDERADCYSAGFSARERVGPGFGPRLVRVK
jgi:hypothetical protein